MKMLALIFAEKPKGRIRRSTSDFAVFHLQELKGIKSPLLRTELPRHHALSRFL